MPGEFRRRFPAVRAGLRRRLSSSQWPEIRDGSGAHSSDDDPESDDEDDEDKHNSHGTRGSTTTRPISTVTATKTTTVAPSSTSLVTTEVTITSQVPTSTVTTDTSLPSDSPAPSPVGEHDGVIQSPVSKGLPPGAIAGIVIALVLLIAAAAVLLVRKRLIANRMKRRGTWTVSSSSGRSFMYGSGPNVRDMSSPQGPHPPLPMPPASLRSYSTRMRSSDGMRFSGAVSNAPVLDASSIATIPTTDSATVRYAFIPTLPDELSIAAGDIVHVLRKYDDGWALCVNRRREQGMVPLECLDGQEFERNIRERPDMRRASSLLTLNLGRSY